MSSTHASVTAALTPERFEEARLLIRHEFAGLDAHAQYFNAFARLLKADPLGRVPMLGTDQRDQFAPLIRAALAAGPQRPLALLDVGCGDGATFELFADAIPDGSTIDLIDPNTDYVAAYVARLARRHDIRLGARHVAGFAPDLTDTSYAPPLSRAYDLILSLHSLYFFDDLAAALADLYARLAPGGLLVVVFADETIATPASATALMSSRWVPRSPPLTRRPAPSGWRCSKGSRAASPASRCVLATRGRERSANRPGCSATLSSPSPTSPASLLTRTSPSSTRPLACWPPRLNASAWASRPTPLRPDTACSACSSRKWSARSPSRRSARLAHSWISLAASFRSAVRRARVSPSAAPSTRCSRQWRWKARMMADVAAS